MNSDQKKKLTLQEKLAKRKYKIPSWPVYMIYRTVMSGLVCPKYKPHYTIIDNINECKGPCFIIWNHLSRLDHAFVMEATHPRRINIIAGYNEFFRSHLHAVFKLNQIVPKKVFCDDIGFVRAVNSLVKQGAAIAFSPEGTSSLYGQNQPIVGGTGRFLQYYKIPVYLVSLKGSYLTSTKHCLDERYGRVEVELRKLFTPEQLESMDPSEIDDRINEAFRFDDFAWSDSQHIKWKHKGNLAEKLYDICWKCPRCGSEIEMDCEGNTIRCRKCGNGANINDYFMFEPFDDKCVIPKYPTKWVEYERQEIIREIRENPDYSFSVKTKLGYLPPYTWVKKPATSDICGEGTITIDHEGFHYRGTKLGEEVAYDVSYKTLFTLCIMTDTGHFTIYINREYIEFYPETPCVGKILLLVEEMHRLHYNIWKNFKWYDYMYEGYELPEPETN